MDAMDDDNDLEPIEIEDLYDDGLEYDYPPTPAVEMAENTLESFLAAAHVDSVYGEPVIHEDTLVLPAAEVISVLAFGAGSGLSKDSKNDVPEAGSGGGSGGGGRILARPVAVIIAGQDGVRVEPVVDVTKIALAGLTALAFLLGMRARFRRMRKALEDVD